MYVEAICPLCFASHIVPEAMLGKSYRCEHCEERFVINRKSKPTNKRPARPPQVKAADEDADVPAAEAIELPEVLPEAKHVEKPRRAKPRPDEDEVLEIPDDALQPVQSRGKPALAPSRRPDEGSRPGTRRHHEDDDGPRERPKTGDGVPTALIIGATAGGIMLLGLIGLGLLWLFRDSPSPRPQPAAQAPPPIVREADAPDPVRPAEPPRANPEPPRVPPPLRQEPPGGPPLLAWDVRADPAPAPVELPIDFKKEIAAPGQAPEVIFPTAPSPFVAIGSNRAGGDERQIWNLQTGQMTGKIAGKIEARPHPVLSPDGAHMAFVPTGAARRGAVDVWAVGAGEATAILLPFTPVPDLLDFAGPGRLLVGRRADRKLSVWRYDATTGQQISTFETALPPWTPLRDAVAISPGGTYLAVVDRETLWVHDIKTGAVAGKRSLPKPAAPLTCHGLSFSPDGRELAALFFGGAAPQVVCWDATRGEVVGTASFPHAKPPHTTVLNAYKGRVIDWLPGRRGWLLYGYKLVERTKDGSAAILPQGPNPRHLVDSGHVAALMPAARPAEMVLSVSRFDPDRPN
jgi:hypothetical protein